MSKKLYVGGLPYSTGEDELAELFEQCGEVVSVKIIEDHATGRSRGFGFVEMATPEGTDRAIEELNGRSVGNRTITVNVAKERQPRRQQQYSNDRW